MELNKDLIVRQIPLFEGFSEEERELIKEYSNILEYEKGRLIYSQGSAADAFYCIIWGRIVIYTGDNSGNNTVLEYLHRGKYFGIISLLTGEPHSVSAQAINDSTLLIIKRDNFDFILKKIPSFAVDLSRTLSRRLKNKAVHQKTIFESAIISVFCPSSQADKSIYALNLALSFYKETKKRVIVLEISLVDSIHSLPQKLKIDEKLKFIELSEAPLGSVPVLKEFIRGSSFGIDLLCITYKDEGDASFKKLTDILSILVNDYNYIILDLPSSMDYFVLGLLNQSDLVHILSGPDAIDLKKAHNLVNRLKTDFKFLESKIKIIVNEYELSKISCREQCELLRCDIYATLTRLEMGSCDMPVLYDPQTEYAKVIRRISRQVGECLLGLALGVGVGYGFCHIGVLKVIEEENIPVDIIAGSSIGALIASLWASGLSAGDILEITEKEFRQPKYTWELVDLTFPIFGFIKGNKLYRFLKKYLGNKTFYDIRMPLKIVASDIARKQAQVLDKGLLIDAVMASCSMPGVFNPFKFKERILFDGGVINPLPTEVLFKMGAKKIIAVNVTPSKEDILAEYNNIKENLNSKKGQKNGGNLFNRKYYFQNKFKTNILDIIFTSVEIMQSEIIEKEALLADLVLHPDTTGLHWLELHRAREFAERGEEYARKNLAKIKEIIGG